MKYVIYLITFLMIAAAQARADEVTRYRVEVLVFSHLGSTETPDTMLEVRGYGDALDFLSPTVTEVDPCDAAVDLAEEDDPTMAGVLELGPLGRSHEPNAVVHLENAGPEMTAAWDRLRRTAPFRPLVFLAWEQGSEPPFPVLRLHDNALAWVEDPRSDLEKYEYEAFDPLEDVRRAAEPAYPADGCFLLELNGLWPTPVDHYLLDGTVSLERSRFLHLDFDLQVRKPMTNWSPLARGGADRIGRSRPVFGVHELRESRQVRSDRLEYFDDPAIGVLARITTLPLADEEERL